MADRPARAGAPGRDPRRSQGELVITDGDGGRAGGDAWCLASTLQRRAEGATARAGRDGGRHPDQFAWGDDGPPGAAAWGWGRGYLLCLVTWSRSDIGRWG